MKLSMSIPLDDGFVRRECPAGKRHFKWFSDETADRPDDAVDPDMYFCPYCGERAPADEWWTQEQLDHAEALAADAIIQNFVDAFKRGFSGRRRGLRVSVSADPSAPPPALAEPPGIVIVEPPCHPWEPLKVEEDWEPPLHCRICGPCSHGTGGHPS
jgi:hypothetical protein